ncbi:hypothetical protein [Thermococcus sp.]
MSIEIRGKEIVITRELSELDRFVFDVVDVLQRHARYVVVSGYVTILFGRSRGTEDVDFVVEPLPREEFILMCEDAQEAGFEFLNPEDCDGLYEMLAERLGIRMVRRGGIIPNAEIKFPKDEFHREALEGRIPVHFNGRTIYISPIELQIAYKLYLGTDKDVEDAFFLYELFWETIDRGFSMTTRGGSGLRFRSKRDLEERLSFIRLYVERLKADPEEVFREQVKLVNSFLASARDFPLSREEYLRMKGELREK